ncbi:GntR family transcriptional regulator [Streptomyces sporangiiformans]|uniref:GntR family transcriptional regulator n=1 Tax=Streptomyces sporangiiformans TaxID=2315329 RepID=A0A505DI12_9ACTN|nr:GntR family transcriptional regulator [Streptomyces sporangiiformans]TPQ21475.1 GntR family transcriptional regulator [Streptomyces sporangiiformans]
MRDEHLDVHTRGSTPPGLVLDRTSRTPLHRQLAEQLKRAIEHGQPAPGSLLIGEIRMAEETGLSRVTVRQAIQSLADQGLLVRRRGIGTLVAHGRAPHTMDAAAVHEDLREAGRAPEAEVLRCGAEPASPEVAAALAITEGTEVTVLERLQYADGLRIGHLRNHLPRDLLLPDALGPYDGRLGAVGLHGLMRAAGVVAYSAQHAIGARIATAEECELLDMTEGFALLTLTRTTFDQGGRAVEYGTHCFPPARRGFEFHLFAHTEAH